MAIPIAMPKLGMTMEEGTLLRWEVEPGGRVEKGAVLYVIESEKTEAEIEATASGVLRHVYVDAGELVPCGTLLAALGEAADEDFDPEAFRREHDRPEAPARPAPAPAAPAAPASTGRSARRPVAPAARKLARDAGIDPGVVPGSGPGGRVTREDVAAWLAAREGRIPVADGVSLEVPSLGEGEPVLLLPGFGTDASVFAAQSQALAAGRRVLGVNPRGVGLSDDPAEPVLTPARMAADAAAVADGPLHVVGASLGAAVALELAVTAPERVRSLALITPFVHVTPRLRAVMSAWARVAALGSPETLARALLPWLFSERWLADEASRERSVRGLAASVARVRAEALERIAAGVLAWSGSRESALARLEVPTLVVVAGRDLLTPDGAAIADAIPGARRLELAEAGHAVTVEAAEAVSAALLGHLGD